MGQVEAEHGYMLCNLITQDTETQGSLWVSSHPDPKASMNYKENNEIPSWKTEKEK